MKVIDFIAYRERNTFIVLVNGKPVKVPVRRLMKLRQNRGSRIKEVVESIQEDIDGQLDSVVQYGYGFNHDEDGGDDDAA